MPSHAPADCRIRPATRDELDRLYTRHMVRHFPAAELKPLGVMHRLRTEGIYDVLLNVDADDGLLAYASLFRARAGSETVLLDYLAVTDRARGQGTGSAFLTALVDTLPSGTVLIGEIEDPERAQTAEERTVRIRRRHFYERLGFVDTQLRTVLFSVPFVIIAHISDTSPDPERIRSALAEIYRVMYQGRSAAMAPIDRIEPPEWKGGAHGRLGTSTRDQTTPG